jgi:hypothetical protein
MTTPAAGGRLNDEVWDVLANLLDAAHGADHTKFTATLDPFTYSTPFEDQQLAALYAYFLLKYRVVLLMGHRPSTSELVDLATQHNREFETLLPGAPQHTLEETLRKVFKAGARQAGVKPGTYEISLITALGVLLREPRADLNEMRAPLTEWCKVNARHLDEARLRATQARLDSEPRD